MKPVRVELAHRANYGVRRGKIEWIVMHYTANDGDSGMSNAPGNSTSHPGCAVSFCAENGILKFYVQQKYGPENMKES